MDVWRSRAEAGRLLLTLSRPLEELPLGAAKAGWMKSADGLAASCLQAKILSELGGESRIGIKSVEHCACQIDLVRPHYSTDTGAF
jgi:hypothetical protein